MEEASYRIGKSQLKILQGDITEQDTDAIVNAANPSLMGGGGVDGAIHRKGGPKILEECRKIRAAAWPKGLPTGKAVITTGGRLKAKYVIHTVGPVWRGGSRDEAKSLAEAYMNSLRLAVDKGLRSISFPSISTGAYGYPIDEACKVAVSTVIDFLTNNGRIDEVRFILFSSRDFEVYKKEVESRFR
ncbi:O-acetyl-ADP-ribose deacetylase [Candidatus Bathyarchaeota archaeon]|nr:O-acetyl-ADP-ribose deacetylase [Candidatus Bathyarchaeota archaeon]